MQVLNCTDASPPKASLPPSKAEIHCSYRVPRKATTPDSKISAESLGFGIHAPTAHSRRRHTDSLSPNSEGRPALTAKIPRLRFRRGGRSLRPLFALVTTSRRSLVESKPSFGGGFRLAACICRTACRDHRLTVQRHALEKKHGWDTRFGSDPGTEPILHT
ncbi:hypothetical protein BDY21DRAFT_350308 [Lineolata rhizophorae]|uniref:Uncharacterized protein n=1 Tax=Lineolata rhizophorae TaxID=578093 RepID=A0A6A6NV01_9PEZI|nr:hypothetical protein BDY21DRAFT_350308 [Lineolata rhizophorae]